MGANSYICRSYRGKTNKKLFLHPLFWIGLTSVLFLTYNLFLYWCLSERGFHTESLCRKRIRVFLKNLLSVVNCWSRLKMETVPKLIFGEHYVLWKVYSIISLSLFHKLMHIGIYFLNSSYSWYFTNTTIFQLRD